MDGEFGLVRPIYLVEDTGTRRDTSSLIGTDAKGKTSHYLVQWTQEIRRNSFRQLLHLLFGLWPIVDGHHIRSACSFPFWFSFQNARP